MMNCKQARDSMLDIVQGAQPAPAIAEHLRACEICSAELERLRSTMSLLDEWQAPEASPYFAQRLRALLREAAQPAGTRGWLAWIRKPALATSLMALIAVGALLYRQDQQIGLWHSSVAVAPAPKGTAVADLQNLDRNQQLYADALLDDIGFATRSSQ